MGQACDSEGIDNPLAGLSVGYQPLEWPPCRRSPSLLQRLCRWWCLGSDYATWRELRRQLGRRGPESRKCWGRDSLRIRTVADVSTIVADSLEWPNTYFVPNDPCQLIFFDPTPDLLCEEALMRISLEYGVPDEVWEKLWSMMYGELIDAILRASSRRPC